MDSIRHIAAPLDEDEDQLIGVIHQLYNANLEPRFQILITQGFIELLVNTVIDARCKNRKKITANSRDFPYSMKLLLLNELNLISDGIYMRLDQMRRHRNGAAHDPFYEMSDVVKFKGGEKARLHEYCIRTIIDFYSEQKEILAPIYAPKTAAGGGGIIQFATDYTCEEQ